MKRTIALLLAALLVLSALAGCGAKPEETAPQSQTNETPAPETARQISVCSCIIRF